MFAFLFFLLLSSCSSVFVFLLVVLCFSNHNISFLFALHLVFWLLLFFLFLLLSSFVLFLNFGNLSNISEEMEIGKTAKMKNAEKKTDILTGTVSTSVLTNSVFFSLGCFFNF